MNTKCENIWINTGGITAITLLLAWLLYFVLDVSVFEKITPKDSDDNVLRYLYSIENVDTTAIDYDDKIVIFDLKAEKSRKIIAEAILTIENAQPKAVILDIIFSDNSETDAYSDSCLQQIVTSFDNIYTAARIADNNVERSFFAKGNNVKEGLVNYSSTFCPYEILRNDTLYRMEYAITGLTGKPNSKQCVNYFNRYFDTLSIKNQYIDSIAKNKIVIVGDLEDLRDRHDMPFCTNGKWRIQGSELLAYSVSTVLNNSWIVLFPNFVAWIFAAIITFFFVYLSCRLKRWERLNDALCNVIIAVLIAVVFILFLFLCYLIFSAFGKVINPVYTLFALPLTVISRDIFDVICVAWQKIVKK